MASITNSLVALLVVCASSLTLSQNAGAASAGDVLVTCAVEPAGLPIGAVDWNDTEIGFQPTPIQSVQVDNESIRFEAIRVAGGVIVHINPGSEQDVPIIPHWGNGNSVEINAGNNRKTTINCYFQHDD